MGLGLYEMYFLGLNCPLGHYLLFTMSKLRRCVLVIYGKFKHQLPVIEQYCHLGSNKLYHANSEMRIR